MCVLSLGFGFPCLFSRVFVSGIGRSDLIGVLPREGFIGFERRIGNGGKC